MADESQWCCPICYGHQEGIASLSPCRHRFCLGCAMRRADRNRRCSLCRTATTSIVFSQRSGDDYFSISITGPAEQWAAKHHYKQGDEEPVPGDEEPFPGAEEPVARAQVGGFPPEVWAEFFKRDPVNIRPLLLWMQGELEVMFEGEWWKADQAEGIIVSYLCLHGLDEEQLVEDLQTWVLGNTEAFVHELISVASRLCSSELQHYLAQENPGASSSPTTSPAATPSPPSSGTPDCSLDSSSSPAGSDVEGHPQHLHRGPNHPPSAPVPVDKKEPQEELGVVVPDASVQGCSHSPSSAGQGRDRSPRGPRGPPKKRAPSPQDSSQPRRRC
ncbi:E3 ubiquitin-protein ligase Topors-like [Heliangelus exortis]|uniref:E3 ubiquitin-protein ligase Topors-like n=1 Tax=Heliangelus exortis TaxID=472823 RepID=UPI003A8CD74F